MRPTSRGFFSSEMIVAAFIVALLFSAIGALVGPIVDAHGQESAKSDTVTSAAYGFDTMERDMRQSDPSDIWACTVSVVVTCSQPSALTTTQYLAVKTADNSSGTFQMDTTNDVPQWQGWVVYSRPVGSSIIYRTFVSSGTFGQPGAQSAVSTASLLPTGTTVAIPAAQSMAIDVNAAASLVDFQLVAAGTGGDASNTTRYSTSILVRN